MMKISVVVPVYNVEEYLEECIRSVLNQTYREFEIILVDDGSTDESGKICDELAKENPGCINVIHKCNQGPLPARMDGIKIAQGDIVLFLDGDDTFQKTALEQIADCFLEYKCDLVLFDTGESISYSCISQTHSLTENVVYQKEAKKVVYHKLITYGIPNGVCLKAIKRDRIILKDDLAEFHDVRYGEDLLMSAYFITACEKVVYLKTGLYCYRARPGSAVHTFDIHRKDSIKTVHTELEKCVDQWDMPELKPVHNIRKVRGWTETLVLLLKNKNALSNTEFHSQLASMAEDPYFLTAYSDVDRTQLSGRYRLLAGCLAGKHYFVLKTIGNILQVVQKVKSGRQHDR